MLLPPPLARRARKPTIPFGFSSDFSLGFEEGSVVAIVTGDIERRHARASSWVRHLVPFRCCLRKRRKREEVGFLLGRRAAVPGHSAGAGSCAIWTTSRFVGLAGPSTQAATWSPNASVQAVRHCARAVHLDENRMPYGVSKALSALAGSGESPTLRRRRTRGH